MSRCNPEQTFNFFPTSTAHFGYGVLAKLRNVFSGARQFPDGQVSGRQVFCKRFSIFWQGHRSVGVYRE